jgi:CRISPR system Cascade subunit CasA
MNLTTDAWIPAVWGDGRPATVSLREAFERGHELQDLAVRPHERIALMRLLVCVAQAALDGPADADEWESCRPRLAAAAVDYLARWRSAFELLGNGPRFLQVANLRKPPNKKKSANEPEDGEGVTPTSKLDLALATNNNPTLFDNAGGSERAFTPGDLALMLLTFQCFSPSGTIGVALWNGTRTAGRGSSKNAPCVAGGMLHALLRGNTLLNSIHRNMMTKRQADQFFGKKFWGRPVWEMMPERPTDASAGRNATATYLGRLVPLTRAIRLADDGRSLRLANGLEYASFPSWREPSATIVVRHNKRQPDRQLLQASVEKSAWRELHALTVKAVSGAGPGGPAVLGNLSDGETFELWVGAMIPKKSTPGKIVDTIESVFPVPAAMQGDRGRAAYERGVRHAQWISSRVVRAVSVYHCELGDDLDRPEKKNRRGQIQNTAAAQFWTEVEGAVPRLLEVTANPASLGLNLEWRGTAWGQAVWKAAGYAYERACPQATPRQIRAYAMGLQELVSRRGEPEATETEPEEEAEA